MAALPSSVDEIFAAAVLRPDGPQRAVFVDAACGNNAELRQRVERLLRAHNDAGSFLESPPTGVAASAEQLRARSCETISLEFLAASNKPGSLGRLGHYEVVEVVGSGGFGIVVKALDEKLHRTVAIKVLAPALAASVTARKRFVRESQAAAAVNHDNVVHIYEVEESGAVPYLVMEYVAGMSLEEKLQHDGMLELKELLRIGLQTAEGLAAAHRQGLVHRDVKPANILLENGIQRVKITDFGLARAVDDASLSQSGTIAGTPSYMSPEQARGESVDHRADIFSLGCVLYAMCTGRSPFRAETAVAAIRRVCDDAPRSIREVNPEIPDWLVAVIEKLHAKNPAERYQSAAEVAQLLSQRLAHLQHPALPGSEGKAVKQSANRIPQSVIGDRRWPIAFAALVLVLIGISLTDATGLTQVLPTVIRVLIGGGTLLVEVHDPGVKVTIEGDGGLVITGAGPQEVRLRPGSYRVRADKDGKPIPLEKDLVTITRGGREVVKVRIEGQRVVTEVPSEKSEKQAFVVLGAMGTEIRKYDTLADAVQGASDGDTIEIRGNGPFVSQALWFKRGALTIRAGTSFRPVVRFRSEDMPSDGVFLKCDVPLVLEGLEFQFLYSGDSAKREQPYRTVLWSSSPCYAANCRFLTAVPKSNCITIAAPKCELRNCEIFRVPARDPAVSVHHRAGGSLRMINCLQAGMITIQYGRQDSEHLGRWDVPEASVHLVGNTFLAESAILGFALWVGRAPDLSATNQHAGLLRLVTSENVFDASPAGVFHLQQYPPGKLLPPGEAESALVRMVGWQGRGNFYAAHGCYLALGIAEDSPQPKQPIKSLADWKQFWGSDEVNSSEVQVRYQGGDLLAKLERAPEKLTLDDFRLRPDSPGYGADPDGKDLGADIDLVGPGAAYERWKKTPEYQEWLKETEQTR